MNEGERIFIGIMKNLEQQVNPETQNILKDICENHVLRVLSSHLEKPVTPFNVAETKRAFLCSCYSEGWIMELFKTADESIDLHDTLQNILNRVVKLCWETEQLEVNPSLSRKVESLIQLGLNDENIFKFIISPQRIKDLLLSQPEIFLRFECTI